MCIRDRPLEVNWVVTIEPGLYFVPAILHRSSLRELHRGRIDFARAESWLGFGGLRIEDDILVTSGEPDVLTAETPSDPDELADMVATAPPILERLC